MKILVAGPQFPDSFARNIATTLQRMGHQVTGVQGLRTRHHGGKLATLFRGYLPKAIPVLEKKLFRGIIKTAGTEQPLLSTTCSDCRWFVVASHCVC